MTSIKKASKDYSFNLSDYLVLLLSCIGYYAFNRYMAKEGYNLKYCLWIHKVESKLHKEYEATKVRGEWFKINSEDIKKIISKT